MDEPGMDTSRASQQNYNDPGDHPARKAGCIPLLHSYTYTIFIWTVHWNHWIQRIVHLNLQASNGKFDLFKKQHIDRIFRWLHCLLPELGEQETCWKWFRFFHLLETCHSLYMGNQIVVQGLAVLGWIMSSSSRLCPSTLAASGTSICRILSLDKAWHGNVSLLFKIQFRTDSRSKVWEVECTMINDYSDSRCLICTLVYCYVYYIFTIA